MQRWQRLCQKNLSLTTLALFHQHHQLDIMSHQLNANAELESLIASTRPDEVDAVAALYIALLMKIMKTPASRENHVVVLQTILNDMKSCYAKALDQDAEKELVQIIGQYGLGNLSLMAPIKLLKDHIEKRAKYNETVLSVAQTHYLSPCSMEMAVLMDSDI